MGCARKSCGAVGAMSGVEAILAGNATSTHRSVVRRGMEEERRAKRAVWRRWGRMVRDCVFQLVFCSERGGGGRTTYGVHACGRFFLRQGFYLKSDLYESAGDSLGEDYAAEGVGDEGFEVSFARTCGGLVSNCLERRTDCTKTIKENVEGQIIRTSYAYCGSHMDFQGCFLGDLIAALYFDRSIYCANDGVASVGVGSATVSAV